MYLYHMAISGSKKSAKVKAEQFSSTTATAMTTRTKTVGRL